MNDEKILQVFINGPDVKHLAEAARIEFALIQLLRRADTPKERISEWFQCFAQDQYLAEAGHTIRHLLEILKDEAPEDVLPLLGMMYEVIKRLASKQGERNYNVRQGILEDYLNIQLPEARRRVQ